MSLTKDTNGQTNAWTIKHLRGSAQELHDLEIEQTRTVRFCEPTTPAIVLGSTQRQDILCHGYLASRNPRIEIARRRSGGGAVLLIPGNDFWVDIVVPRQDRLWTPDVRKAFNWVGELWREVLAGLGIEGARQHDGEMRSDRWSKLVCFAGLGPGEITVNNQKIVGISSRRTRDAALFQCSLVKTMDVSTTASCFDIDPAALVELEDALRLRVKPLPDIKTSEITKLLLEALNQR